MNQDNSADRVDEVSEDEVERDSTMEESSPSYCGMSPTEDILLEDFLLEGDRRGDGEGMDDIPCCLL